LRGAAPIAEPGFSSTETWTAIRAISYTGREQACKDCAGRASKHDRATLYVIGGRGAAGMPNFRGDLAGRLQREIRLDRGADVGFAAVEQRPAAVGALHRPQVAGNPRLQFRLDAAEVMLQQDEFGRDCRVGFELEDPVAVAMLQRHQRFAGAGDGLVEPRQTLGTVRHYRRLCGCCVTFEEHVAGLPPSSLRVAPWLTPPRQSRSE